MSLIVPRTCTELHVADEDQRRKPDSRPLASYRDVPAYVLLGDPGAGKTIAFRTECEALGDEALPITARDFTTFDPDDHPEWRSKTLFIDGLDEVRVGAVDARTPFDGIRARLDKLGNPRFRLSCRHADWLGPSDRRHLWSVSPQDSQVTVLGIDPLSETHVAQIVDARTRITDSQAFIQTAREMGITGLLGNPQSLLLLAEVVEREGRWPTSRLDLFDRACSLLVSEQNEEHLTAASAPPAPDLLDAAGGLCAVLIISGSVGYVLRHGQGNDDFLTPEDCGHPSPELLRHALTTRLFTAESEGRFVPVHRHIAEFLGAKHLARIIDNGLPPRRVIALLSGEDAIVVSNHRGVSAWLAALCTNARPDLVERDPIGVVSYGDVRAFSTDLKVTLLHALSGEASRLHSVLWAATTIGCVATLGMEPALRSVLESHNAHPPVFVLFVLFALAHGEPLPSLADSLLDIVFAENASTQYAKMALKAFLHNCHSPDNAAGKLLELLAVTFENRIDERQDDLTAVALGYLYPAHVAPAQIWDYLIASTDGHAPDYEHFWKLQLIERSTDSAIAVLLDGLATRGHGLKPALKNRHLNTLPAQLLARGLEAWGDVIDRKRLSRWLGVDMFRTLRTTSHEARQRIRVWLTARPQIQNRIVADYVSRTTHVIISETRLREITFDSPLPSDFGTWCLERARTATDTRTAETYLRLSLDHGVPRDILLQREQEPEPLQRVITEMLVCHLPPSFFEDARQRQSYRDESERRRRHFVSLVKAKLTSLRENRGEAGLLWSIADAYYGLSPDVNGSDPGERIKNLFGGDHDLIDAAFSALRDAPFRQDIPDVGKLIPTLIAGREHLALPVLAGLDELDDLRTLDDRQLRQALAFHFLVSTENTEERQRRLFDVSATSAAEVLAKCAVARLRNGGFDANTARMLNSDECSSIGGSTALLILEAFPLRGAQPTATAMLDYLLVAALRHADRAVVVTLISRKLSRASLSAAQRLRWLAGGVIVDSDSYFEPLKRLVGKRTSRVSELAIFLTVANDLLEDLPTQVLTWFVELLGSNFAPGPLTDFSTYERPLDTSFCVSRMVRVLAERPDRATSAVLVRLADDEALDRWHDSLAQARDRQRVILRDAGYRHPTPADVCTTLKGGTPASAGDLAPLLIDRLLELARGIRDGNTDDWRQYWNVDQYGRPLQPRPENVCRDALLSDLRRLLPANVTARREGSYADDNRADIVVWCGDFEVPIEIKRNSHRDLWSAVHDQLIAKYGRDPATGGYGIYLVFWFGQDDTQPPPIGPPPAGPRELQERVEGLLSDAERRKVSVVVLDVSRPV